VVDEVVDEVVDSFKEGVATHVGPHALKGSSVAHHIEFLIVFARAAII
jgi:hypothetical protein